MDHQRGHRLVGWRGAREPLEVPEPLAVAHEAKARTMQFNLAKYQVAVHEFFLVMVQDQRRYMDQLGPVRIVAPRQPQIVQGNAPEQAQAGAVDGNDRTGKETLQLGNDLFAD